MKLLSEIQQQLKAPKGQLNKFGGYKYRSCEDILEAVKPLLGGGILTIADDIALVGDRYYVKATATLTDTADKSISCSAFARESLDKKGMDLAQITGAASSYARKYALNGLLCIDDTKDADDNNKDADAKGKGKKTPPASTKDIVEQALVLWNEKHKVKANRKWFEEQIKKLPQSKGKLPTNKASIPKIVEAIKLDDETEQTHIDEIADPPKEINCTACGLRHLEMGDGKCKECNGQLLEA